VDNFENLLRASYVVNIRNRVSEPDCTIYLAKNTAVLFKPHGTASELVKLVDDGSGKFEIKCTPTSILEFKKQLEKGGDYWEWKLYVDQETKRDQKIFSGSLNTILPGIADFKIFWDNQVSHLVWGDDTDEGFLTLKSIQGTLSKV
jgi:hypothetical protein